MILKARIPVPTSSARGARAITETGPPVSGSAEADAVGLAVGDAVRLAVGEAVGLAVGLAVGEASGLALSEGGTEVNRGSWPGTSYPPPSVQVVPSGNWSSCAGHGSVGLGLCATAA